MGKYGGNMGIMRKYWEIWARGKPPRNYYPKDGVLQGKYEVIRGIIGKYGVLRGIIGKYGELRGNMGYYEEIWGIIMATISYYRQARSQKIVSGGVQNFRININQVFK